ncbi:hypothetical protein ACFPYJ_23325 [Paenibacillus solisilvae]|uniref:Uncharacterized protein n=1 Tax=Paenibacillus solisilvae TaxID=2486751 RepID=A0ABW0W1H4_9BACL
MNHKLIISRVALSSALLMSAVAAPAVSNAASTAPMAKYELAPKLISAQAGAAAPTRAIPLVNSFTNPLELAEKYAPDTVDDWKQTLDQYEKAIGPVMSGVYTAVEAKPVHPADPSISTSAASSISISAAPIRASIIKAAPAAEVSAIKIKAVPITSGTQQQLQTLSKTDQVTTAVVRAADDSELAFIRAEIGLAKAVESKDAAIIKQSLGKLLVQYKQQIAEWEAAE